ncbi:D-aminoacylase [Pseudonocardia adelaidensis]|uniref:D-aminoacylase n=2 Tax=Pseudonocardia adelaidensis TaxID=648754 RepID=A0ABP9NWH3_9PSEU
MLLRGGRVLDGTGADRGTCDVLLDGERIAALGPDLAAGEGTEVVDVAGRYVLPGFIDVHAHDDLAVLDPAGCLPKLRQGVTTVVVGNCGHGPAPTAGGVLADYSAPVIGRAPGRVFATFGDYLDAVAAAPRTTNVAALVPHGPLRAAVMGAGARAASAGEVDGMAGLLSDALAAGGAGLSLGLMYAPGNAAAPDELGALAEVVARHGRLLVAHVRNEAGQLLDSLREVCDVAQRAGCGLQISHLKVTGPEAAGSMPRALELLGSYRAAGLDVTADVYPYTAGSTTAATLFPPSALADGLTSLLGALRDRTSRAALLAELDRPWPRVENYLRCLGPDRILLAGFTAQASARYEGAPLAAIAGDRGQEPGECLADLLLEENGLLTAVLFQTDPGGVEQAMRWPYTMIGTDGLPGGSGYVHPRLYGTFPRVLESYTGDGRPWDPATAAHRIAGLPARRFGLADRGELRPGAVADLVVLDPGRWHDRATFEDPRNSPDGLELVVMGGRVVLGRHGEVTGEPAGRLLRRR